MVFVFEKNKNSSELREVVSTVSLSHVSVLGNNISVICDISVQKENEQNYEILNKD